MSRPLPLALLLVLGMASAACFSPETERCTWGTICPPGTTCHAPTQSCVTPQQIQACLDQPELAPCTFFGIGLDARCLSGVCREPFCGDGIVDPGEVCDDANQVSHDGCSALCRREVPTWRELPSTPSPSRRGGHAMVYDAARGVVVLFGGGEGQRYDTLSGATALGDTWEHDGNGWLPVTVGIAPPPRWGHAMAYDRSAGRAVLFGGQDASGTRDDTWLYDGTWRESAPGAGPSARAAHAMAYLDRAQRVVLFGGLQISPLGDTWAFDGDTWSPRSPPTSPPARFGHAMSADPRGGGVILHGGANLFAVVLPRDDAWRYDGETWTQLAFVDRLPERMLHAMTTDPRRGRLWVFGGFSQPEVLGVLGDTAEGQPDGTWTGLAPGDPPLGRAAAALVYDEDRAWALLFGGVAPTAGATALADTWILAFQDPLGTCGDDVAGPEEVCDGLDWGLFAGLDCEALGFRRGELRCGPTCRFDLTDCER